MASSSGREGSSLRCPQITQLPVTTEDFPILTIRISIYSQIPHGQSNESMIVRWEGGFTDW